jgi:hypothetical protein
MRAIRRRRWGPGTVMVALSLFLQRGVLTDPNFIKEPQHEL